MSTPNRKRLVTCPACHTPVLPTSEDHCPACRRYNFRTAEAQPPPHSEPEQAEFRTFSHGAGLHRRLLALFAVNAILFVVESVVGDALLPGQPPLRVRMAALFLMVIAFVVQLGTAFQLAEWLGLSGRVWVAGLLIPGANLFVFLALLKRSVVYFEVNGVRAGILGPSATDVRARDGRR